MVTIAAVDLDEQAQTLWDTVRAACAAGQLRAVVDAVRALTAISERRAALLGLDAPRRQAVEVITQELLDQEIARLKHEIAKQEATVPAIERGEAMTACETGKA
jgi:hypothetical protein